MSLVVCAHRGNSGEFPENTVAAFRSAVELGADMVEFDVTLTTDGAAVISHDATVDRATDGSGAIAEMRLDEFRRLRSDGEPAATLEDALDALPPPMVLNIHVKEHAHDVPVLCQLVSAALRERELLGRAFIAGTDEVMAGVLECAPEIQRCCLSGQQGDSYLDHAAGWGCTILQPGHEIITPDFVRAAHDRGMTMNVFYADTGEEMERLMDCGVDGILTNYPQRLLSLVGRHVGR